MSTIWNIRSHLLYLAFVFILAHIVHATRHHVKRKVCTVYSRNDPRIDDVQEINDAFEECGNTGRIALWAEDTFNIRSPIDLSQCIRCELSINGIMKLSADLQYWTQQSAVFKVANTSNVVITSESTGTIDANDFGALLPDGQITAARYPDLFRISDQSTQIYVRNLIIHNSPGTVFHVDRSSAVRFEGIDVQTAARTGLLVENSQHVYLWRAALRALSSCVAITPNSSNVQVEEVSCLDNATVRPASNGIELRLADSNKIQTIQNIFVKTFRAIGRMNAVAFMFTQSRGTGSPKVQNATFSDVDLGSDSRQAVLISPHSGKLVAEDITFRNFNGVSEVDSDLKCPEPEDVCEFIQEGWNITVKG